MSETAALRVPFRLQVGRLLCRQFRAALDEAAIPYIEHKGWLDSLFVVSATTGQRQRIARWMDVVNHAGAVSR